MTIPRLEALSPDLLLRIIKVACADHELPDLADELASLVLRSTGSLAFCDVYVLDDDDRTFLCPGRPPVLLGDGLVGWVAAHGKPRRHADRRGAAIPIRPVRPPQPADRPVPPPNPSPHPPHPHPPETRERSSATNPRPHFIPLPEARVGVEVGASPVGRSALDATEAGRSAAAERHASGTESGEASGDTEETGSRAEPAGGKVGVAEDDGAETGGVAAGGSHGDAGGRYGGGTGGMGGRGERRRERGAKGRKRALGGVIAVLDVRSGGLCAEEDLELVAALATLFAPVLRSCRRLRSAREREHSAERFAEQAVEVQEAERARLVRELHDGPAQRLAGLGFHLSAADRLLPQHPEEAHAQVALARDLCELTVAETRAAISGLRPPVLDDLGLSAALATLAREACLRQPALDIAVTVTGEQEGPLPDHLQTALYRIAQEAVGNILNHARARCVDLILEHRPDRVVLRVSDDGSGFRMSDVGPGSYGLKGMAERAELLGGRTSVSSRPGEGTTVRTVIPR